MGDFLFLDLRDPRNCRLALTMDFNEEFDEVYQLAADMGGMGFIHNKEDDIVVNNTLINTHMANVAIRDFRVPRYFFSSSVCVYRDMKHGEPPLDEKGAIPANPDNEYGWEKLYAEIVAQTIGKKTLFSENRMGKTQGLGNMGLLRNFRNRQAFHLMEDITIAERSPL